MYEDYEEYPELTLEEKFLELRQKMKCKLMGHIFENYELLYNPDNEEEIVTQRCACNERQYVYKKTGLKVPQKILNPRIHKIIKYLMNQETLIFNLLPKTPFHK